MWIAVLLAGGLVVQGTDPHPGAFYAAPKGLPAGHGRRAAITAAA